MKSFTSLWFLLLSSLFFITTENSMSQKNNRLDSLIIENRNNLQAAYDYQDEDKMIESRAAFERLLDKGEEEWLVRYYIGLADYYIGQSFLITANKEKAKKYIDDGIEQLEECIDLNEKFSEGYVLLAHIYGSKISILPISAMTLGVKSSDLISTAKRLEPSNPRIYLVSGISSFFTPKMFGGGEKKAKESLLIAVKLFPKYNLPRLSFPIWGYEETYVWLGRIAEKQDSLQLAKEYYEKALEIKPNYPWVKYKLLPDLKRKMKTD